MRARQNPCPAFLSYGFRPFFLMACAYASIAMAAWLYWIAVQAGGAGVAAPDAGFDLRLWHAHEMLFGYTVAVIAGFFLTAVPNWTKTEPVRGSLLAGLAAIWAAGRIAVWGSPLVPAAAVAIIDLAFVPALAALLIGALSTGWSKRNLVFLPILAALFVANLMFHLERFELSALDPGAALRLALDSIVVLIVIIGGRIVPAFTHNALHRRGEAPMPASRPPIEAVSIAAVVVLAGLNVAGTADRWVGAAAVIAALANGLRLAGWRGTRILDEPIVWILHVGYGWLVVGLALEAAVRFGGGVPSGSAIHVLTVGAIGSMTVGVMTRAGLGHTGRALKASRLMVVAYVGVSVAAVVRGIGPIAFPEFQTALMTVSGAIWVGLFALVTVVFWPILTRPRLRVEPGE